MASFLQNHGDIILDAVLTDYGRKLLAKGDGSFNISKFAFADDEIDYTLFDPNKNSFINDEKIMETPIMEAVTNNAASMKCPLISLTVDNILFMPVMKLNTNLVKSGSFDGFTGFIIPVDNNNVDTLRTSRYLTSNNSYFEGVLNNGNREIIVDHGLDSDKLNKNESLRDRFPMMFETQFNVYVDNRFSSLGKNNNSNLSAIMAMSVDDDNVAIYKITDQTVSNGLGFVTTINTTDLNTPIRGTKGTRTAFTLIPNLDLTATDTLFNKYGKVMKLKYGSNDEFYTIRSFITIEGINTGCSIEIPVLFAKIKIS